LGLAAAGCGSSGPSGGAATDVAVANVARTSASSIPNTALDLAVSANNAFAIHLYAQESPSATSSNLVISPASASLALTMTYAGAKGQTATEMATALGFAPDAGTTIFDGQNALSQALAARGSAAHGEIPDASAGDFELEVVNSLWGERTETWETPFLETLASSYGAGVHLEDFITQPDTARLAINAWVSTSTDDKINDLLPPPAVDSLTRLVLVNAVHLRFPWENPFDTSLTAPGTFTRGDGTTVSPSFMKQGGYMPYLDDGKAQIVSLPLAGGQLAVVIAVPHADVELATYEASLQGGSAALAPPSDSADVVVSLPKVSFTSKTFSLETALQAMGMIQAFKAGVADFSGMTSTEPLYVGDVLQKAMMDMQESGVEAAAATAVVLAAGSAPTTPTLVTANRPYLMTIVDVPTGAILFLGHIEDPTDAGSP
jgi:serpin B